jgi:hypothetical protein
MEYDRQVMQPPMYKAVYKVVRAQIADSMSHVASLTTFPLCVALSCASLAISGVNRTTGAGKLSRLKGIPPGFHS